MNVASAGMKPVFEVRRCLEAARTKTSCVESTAKEASAAEIHARHTALEATGASAI
jgi:hypothetical protein